MGLWDVLLFNIATVLGPRWIAAAAHNGPSSISLWLIAAVFFFVPTALVIVELSSRFPEEGGLYAWSRDAFGEFHGFVAGWTYWVYTFFYFPGLLFASAAMSAYIGGIGSARLAQAARSCWSGSFVFLLVAVYLNLIGLRIGKWLQNAGGVGTYVPLLMLVVAAALVWHRRAPRRTSLLRHAAALELGRGQFLAATGLRVHRTRADLHDERGGPRPAEDAAPGRVRLGRADRA